MTIPEGARALCERFGIAPGRLPALTGSAAGAALIAASGRCVWDDLELIPCWRSLPCIAVNDMIMHYPLALEHAYSNDRQTLPHWVAGRREEFRRRDAHVPITHTCRATGADHCWPWPGHGTSSLNAVYTALALGYQPLYLAGVPLTNDGRYFEPPWRGSAYEGERRYWVNVADILRGRVRAVSGYLHDLLGA